MSIEVKSAGRLGEDEEHTTYYSHFGPMLEDKDLPWTRERAYAIRDSNLDNNRSTEQYLKFARARSVSTTC